MQKLFQTGSRKLRDSVTLLFTILGVAVLSEPITTLTKNGLKPFEVSKKN
jgi:hypothetical protein